MLTHLKTMTLVSLALVGACTSTTKTTPVRFAPEMVRADLDELYSSLEAAHVDLFARTPRAEQERVLAQLRSGVDRPMSAAEVHVVFQRFVAAGKIAHARVDFPIEEWERYRAVGGSAVPLALRVDGERVSVLHVVGADDIEIGDVVVAVDELEVFAWLGRLRAHVSADNDLLAYTQLEHRLPLLTWVEFGEIDGVWLEVERQGQRRRVRVPAITREVYAERVATVPPGFELDPNLREARMIEPAIAYLRPGPFYDNRPDAANPWDPSAFVAFVDRAFEEFLEAEAPSLIVDLRSNPGGDNSFSDPLVAWIATEPFRFASSFRVKSSEAARRSNARRLAQGAADDDSIGARFERSYAATPVGELFDFEIAVVPPRPGRRFEGKVFMLVDRHSYSNAVTVAALAQDYGFATILGEETADLASTHGAMETFTLPRTGVEVGFPKALIVRPSGDTTARGVVPDVAIAAPVGRVDSDVVLARAIEIVRDEGRWTRPGSLTSHAGAR